MSQASLTRQVTPHMASAPCARVCARHIPPNSVHAAYLRTAWCPRCSSALANEIRTLAFQAEVKHRGLGAHNLLCCLCVHVYICDHTCGCMCACMCACMCSCVPACACETRSCTRCRNLSCWVDLGARAPLACVWSCSARPHVT